MPISQLKYAFLGLYGVHPNHNSLIIYIKDLKYFTLNVILAVFSLLWPNCMTKTPNKGLFNIEELP